MKKLLIDQKEIKKIGFFGLGATTAEMLKYFKSSYKNLHFVLRYDKEPKKENLPLLSEFNEIYFGKDVLSNLYEDVIFLSPSVRRERLLKINAKTVICSDAEYFFKNTEAETFGITGSDGKSTTVTLTKLLLSGIYRDVFAIGNIGRSMTPFLEYGKNYAAVCELSSFQLNYFSPRLSRALITNVTPNHLNWHTSLEEYVAAKKAVFHRAEKKILNLDSPVCQKLATENKCFCVYSASQNYADLAKSFKSEHYTYIEGDAICLDGKSLLKVSEIKSRQKHNILNFMAAVSICADLPIEVNLKNAAKSFCGLPHRCETVGVYNGIKFINSSIDSSPQRTQTTLDSIDERVIIILGGKNKALDYSLLLPSLRQKAKAIILTGESGEEILETIQRNSSFSESDISYIYLKSFDSAVDYAIKTAVCGDTVLLSPASTSFDSFSNFEERGEHFKDLIKARFSNTEK